MHRPKKTGADSFVDRFSTTVVNRGDRKRPREDDDEGTAIRPHVPRHPFQAEFNDHFETDLTAIRDVLPCVEELRSIIRPNCPETFSLYDPYYCDGKIVGMWKSCGVGKIYHENRDFYKDIDDDECPKSYDMLVTNPPYSGNHIQRLFIYLVEAKRPFAVLIPDYVASKDWYQMLVRRHFSMIGEDSSKGLVGNKRLPFKVDGVDEVSAGPSTIGIEPFYIVPKVWYQFTHPLGVGRSQGSHFKTMWYVWLGRRTTEVVCALKCKLESAPEDSKAVEVVHGLVALERGHHIRVAQRKNPKQRQQLRQKRRVF